MLVILRIVHLFWGNRNLFTGDSAVQDNLTFIRSMNVQKCHISVTKFSFQNFKSPKPITLSEKLTFFSQLSVVFSQFSVVFFSVSRKIAHRRRAMATFACL